MQGNQVVTKPTMMFTSRWDASVSESERGEKRRERYHTVPIHATRVYPLPYPPNL